LAKSSKNYDDNAPIYIRKLETTTMEDLILYLIQPPFPEIILVLRILFFIFSFFLFFCVIYFLLKTDWLKRIFFQDLIEFLTFQALGTRKVIKAWLRIQKRVEKETESEAKLAIIEAEDLLNEVLKKMGYEGESLGERLKQLKETLPNLAEISEAHKICSNIIHDPTYRLNLAEAERILKIYEKALVDLEVL